MKTTDKLTSRERVLKAINHQEIDRLPRDFGSEEVVIEGLLLHLNLKDIEALKRRFKVDMERVRVSYRCPYTDGRNIWGLKYKSTNLTQNISHHPLANVTTLDKVNTYLWPDPDWVDIKSFKERAIEARKTGRAVIGSSWGSIFGESYRLMGMDNFMMAMKLYPETVAAVINHATDFFLEVDRRIFQTCKGLIDLSFHGNDFGSQKGLLFSRKMFQDFFAEPAKKLIDQARSFGIRPMYHSCGAIREIIPDLIDCGVEVIDPIQTTARGMNPKELKEQFGSYICFHGAISAQKVLPFGNRDQIYEHVKEVCEIMKKGGGYIVTSDQAITSDTPVDNVLSMYDAIEQFGY